MLLLYLLFLQHKVTVFLKYLMFFRKIFEHLIPCASEIRNNYSLKTNL
jgi:hypothetical protein